MNIYDPLYGKFVLPPHLSRLIVSPEVRRLSQIRLLNTLTPSMATLGELRRYSHTIGVLILSSECDLSRYSTAERQAFQASILLHDAGTPPFAHLFEYHLRERSDGWNHEQVARSVLWGFHAAENRAHQLFAGRAIEFRRALEESSVDISIVEDILLGRHPLARLLFGSLDLDNIDNVCRMGWALGLEFDRRLPVALAAALSVDARSSSLRCHRRDESLVAEWQDLRRRVYNLLVFDGPTVAAQATLSAAIEELMNANALAEDDWSMTDEQMIDKLLGHPSTKKSISKEYLGALPHTVFIVQCDGPKVEPVLSSREVARRLIEQALRETFPNQKVLGYAFRDRGAFSKRIAFQDSGDGTLWECGFDSRSVVLYGFLRSRAEPSQKKCREAARRLIQSFSEGEGAVMLSVAGRGGVDAQRPLGFEASID